MPRDPNRDVTCSMHPSNQGKPWNDGFGNVGNPDPAPKVSIIDELKKLMRDEITEVEHDCTAFELTGVISTFLSEIILKDAAECDKLCDWEQEIRELRCTIIGEHVWTIDQCGYWGHQYCLGCNQPKYPELGKLSCREAIEKVGRIEESEYKTKI